MVLANMQEVIALDISASAKLAVIWIINTIKLSRNRPILGFDLTSLAFSCKILHTDLFFFTLHVF